MQEAEQDRGPHPRGGEGGGGALFGVEAAALFTSPPFTDGARHQLALQQAAERGLGTNLLCTNDLLFTNLLFTNGARH